MANKPTPILLNKPPIFKLNRKQLSFIFDYLDIENLSKLRKVCRRFSNTVEYCVQDLQVFTEEDYVEPVFQTRQQVMPGFKSLTLRTCSPGDFFYPHFPFKSLKKLYLCYEDQHEKLNLTQLMQLRFLKVRGALTLSRNPLPNVTHIDIDYPCLCENQVFPNLKSFNLDFDVAEFSNLEKVQMTEAKAVEYAFEKSMDILRDKSRLETVSFTVRIPQMELLLFEQFVDSFMAFMQTYEKEINLPGSKVRCKLLYNAKYTIADKDRLRWHKAWLFLGGEDAVPDPTFISTRKNDRSEKTQINPDEYNEKKPEEITKQFANLEFVWEGYNNH